MLNNLFDTKYFIAFRRTILVDVLIVFFIVVGGLISHYFRTGEPSFYAITSNLFLITASNALIFVLIFTIYVSKANREI